jgi:DNA processing protein
VPGHPLDTRASGCNALLRDGATLVRDADDVLEVLETVLPAARAVPEQVAMPLDTPPPAIDVPSDQILALLAITPVAEEQLARDLGLDPVTLSALVAPLELAGQVERSPGNVLTRTG